MIGGLVLTRYVGRRLNAIADAVQGVSAGDLSRRVALIADGRDAFDRLALQLNRMLGKIERLMTELRVMTDSLAHDLRSPIARLRSKAEAAVLQGDGAGREAALGGLLAETDQVMRMLSMLLEIGRSESVQPDRFVTIHPERLLEEIADLYAPVVEDAGLGFPVDITPCGRAIALHRELLSQSIANLIDNALHHAGGGGEVALSFACAGGEARFEVSDRGPGIATVDRPQALKRFGRLDDARSTPGAGLGLALVEAVARLHGGRLALEDNEPGLIAAIVLPLGG